MHVAHIGFAAVQWYLFLCMFGTEVMVADPEGNVDDPGTDRESQGNSPGNLPCNTIDMWFIFTTLILSCIVVRRRSTGHYLPESVEQTSPRKPAAMMEYIAGITQEFRVTPPEEWKQQPDVEDKMPTYKGTRELHEHYLKMAIGKDTDSRIAYEKLMKEDDVRVEAIEMTHKQRSRYYCERSFLM